MLKSLLMLAIFTAFTVFAWISLTIYHNLNTSTISPEVESQIKPIFSTFDMQAVENLRQQEVIDVDLSQQYLTGEAPITQKQTTSQAASESATPSPTRTLTTTPKISISATATPTP